MKNRPPSPSVTVPVPAGRKKSRLPWLLAALWAALIFGLSSLPGSQVPSVDFPHLDKIVHFFLYGTLGFLVGRALGRSLQRPGGDLSGGAFSPRLIALAAGLAVLYGATDEFHQLFVRGRSADLADLGADALGGLVGALVAEKLRRWRGGAPA